MGCVRQRRQPAPKVFRRFSKGPLPITLSPTMNLKFQMNHPGQYYSETMTTRGRAIAPPAPFNVEDGSSGVRRTEPRRKKFMDRGQYHLYLYMQCGCHATPRWGRWGCFFRVVVRVVVFKKRKISFFFKITNNYPNNYPKNIHEFPRFRRNN